MTTLADIKCVELYRTEDSVGVGYTLGTTTDRPCGDIRRDLMESLKSLYPNLIITLHEWCSVGGYVPPPDLSIKLHTIRISDEEKQ